MPCAEQRVVQRMVVDSVAKYEEMRSQAQQPFSFPSATRPTARDGDATVSLYFAHFIVVILGELTLKLPKDIPHFVEHLALLNAYMNSFPPLQPPAAE
jgi:hypothetical protein